ncbi:MAG: glycosyl hydrolase, partial [Alphaproteobacteria bacterium]
MIDIDTTLTAADLSDPLKSFWDHSATKIRNLDKSWDASTGAPVYTVAGKYSSRGWTEWTQGFQFGSALLQFDATGDEDMLAMGRDRTLEFMAPHVTHFGVHDHGFNNVSTYGNLRRLMSEGKIADNRWEREFYDMALKASGAVQARRWTEIADGTGYVYSFNGPHSLFVDTLRTLRAPAVAHLLGHRMSGEHDASISLLDRIVRHIQATDKYIVYYGEGRDFYDERGRTCHEAIFNLN